MPTPEEFAAAFKVVDDETTRIGQLVIDLVAQLAAGGLTKEQEEAIFTQITGHGERLKTIAVNPANPVPDPLPPA